MCVCLCARWSVGCSSKSIQQTDDSFLARVGMEMGDGEICSSLYSRFSEKLAVRELTQGDSLSAQRRAQCAGRARTGSERGDRDESLPESTTTHRARVD